MARQRPPWMRAIEDVLLPSAANGALLERSAPAVQQHRLPPIERRLTTMGREFVSCASATSSASRTSGRAPTHDVATAARSSTGAVRRMYRPMADIGHQGLRFVFV